MEAKYFLLMLGPQSNRQQTSGRLRIVATDEILGSLVNNLMTKRI